MDNIDKVNRYLKDFLNIISPEFKKIIFNLVDENIRLNKELNNLKARFAKEIKSDIEKTINNQRDREKNCPHLRVEDICHQGGCIGTKCLDCGKGWG